MPQPGPAPIPAPAWNEGQGQGQGQPLGSEPSWGPRIAPSPPQRKTWPAVLITLLLALLVFGPAGGFVGYTVGDRKDGPKPTPSTSSKPSTPSPAPYEAHQLARNKTKFSGELAALAEPWLPWIGGCTNNADPQGPKLGAGEQTKVTCEYSNVNIFFIEFKSLAERDKVVLTRQRQNLDAQELTPGIAAGGTRKSGTSGKSTGNYIEFAYRSGTGADSFALCGIWWDKDNTPVAAYFELRWADREDWEPLRELWQRYS